MHKNDLALNKPKRLICHRTKPNHIFPNYRMSVEVRKVNVKARLEFELAVQPQSRMDSFLRWWAKPCEFTFQCWGETELISMLETKSIFCTTNRIKKMLVLSVERSGNKSEREWILNSHVINGHANNPRKDNYSLSPNRSIHVTTDRCNNGDPNESTGRLRSEITNEPMVCK